MAFAHSPKTSTEGLVFIYDTGNRKSYKGEPTTNEFLTTTIGNYSGYGGNGTLMSGTLDPFGTTSNPVYRKTGKLRFGPTGGEDVGTLYYGNTYTFSIYLRFASGEATWTGGEFDLYDRTDSKSFSGGLGDNMSYEWKRFSVTAYHNNSANYHFVDIGYYQGTNVFEWCCPQIDFGDHATPFTPNTRSATEGLKDLTGNLAIDLSNVSFDANAQMAFDGSSDHVTGVLPISGGGEPHTIELVLSPDINQSSFGSRRDPFSIGNATTHQYSALDINTGYMNWYFYGKDTSLTNTPSLIAGNYYHFILSYAGGFSNNTNKRVWINGVEQTLSSGVNEVSLLPDNPQFSIGRDIGRTTAYFPGEIPIFKVYNKALTEEQALGNFNAIKNRFGI